MTEDKLLLATTNSGKAREIGEYLKNLPLTILCLADVLPGHTCPERGRSFIENARAKSLFYSRLWSGPVLAEDSGLEIDALGGAPGVYSARFSGARSTDDKNIRKVLRLLLGIPPRLRRARFVCTLVLSDGGRIIKEFRGEVRGRIAVGPKGDRGFGYDPIFYYHPLRKTFGELGAEEKNAVSHRGRALRKLKAFLEIRPVT